MISHDPRLKPVIYRNAGKKFGVQLMLQRAGRVERARRGEEAWTARLEVAGPTASTRLFGRTQEDGGGHRDGDDDDDRLSTVHKY